MAVCKTREQLKDYSLRKLGYPVLEINVDDDQVDDVLDDAIQYFQERHYDGSEKAFLKHELTASNLATIKSGTTTTTGSGSGYPNNASFTEKNNYIQLPDHVLGVEKVFKMDASTISSGLFNIKYQIFLNDLYYYGALDLMNYAMVKTYLEDLSRLITPDVQLRFNKKRHRLYLDIDWDQISDDTYLIVECTRLVDPSGCDDLYNDWWLKRYVTSLVKRQWGINMMKFQGVMLPGGVSLNGRQMFDDAIREIEQLEYELKTEYELPPLDMIG